MPRVNVDNAAMAAQWEAFKQQQDASRAYQYQQRQGLYGGGMPQQWADRVRQLWTQRGRLNPDTGYRIGRTQFPDGMPTIGQRGLFG